MLPPPLADGGVGGGADCAARRLLGGVAETAAEASGAALWSVVGAGAVAGCAGVALLSVGTGAGGVGAAGAVGGVAAPAPRVLLLVVGVVGGVVVVAADAVSGAVADAVANETLLSLLVSDVGCVGAVVVAGGVALLSGGGAAGGVAAPAPRALLPVVGVVGVGGAAGVAVGAVVAEAAGAVVGVVAGVVANEALPSTAGAGGVVVTGCGAPLPLLTAGVGGVGAALLAGGVTITGGADSQGVCPLTMMPLPLKILIRSSSSEPVLTRSTVSASACEYGILLLLITSAVLGSTSIGASLLAGTQDDNTKISIVKRPALETCRFNCSEIIRFSL